MVAYIKYMTEADSDCTAECAEKLVRCEGHATHHICFEDGSGRYVCERCFEQRVNSGTWITDAAESLLAS